MIARQMNVVSNDIAMIRFIMFVLVFIYIIQHRSYLLCKKERARGGGRDEVRVGGRG